MRYFINGTETTEEAFNDFVRAIDDTESFIKEIEELEEIEQQLSFF